MSSWTWLLITGIALMTVANLWMLISLRRRIGRAESQTAVLRVRLRRLERDVGTMWVSPNHRLPPIKTSDLGR